MNEQYDWRSFRRRSDRLGHTATVSDHPVPTIHTVGRYPYVQCQICPSHCREYAYFQKLNSYIMLVTATDNLLCKN